MPPWRRTDAGRGAYRCARDRSSVSGLPILPRDQTRVVTRGLVYNVFGARSLLTGNIFTAMRRSARCVQMVAAHDPRRTVAFCARVQARYLMAMLPLPT